MGAGASAAQTQNRLPDGKASFEIKIVGDEQTFVTELKEAACKQSLQLGLLAPFIERIVHEKGKKIACCAVQVNGKLQNSHEIRGAVTTTLNERYAPDRCSAHRIRQ